MDVNVNVGLAIAGNSIGVSLIVVYMLILPCMLIVSFKKTTHTDTKVLHVVSEQEIATNAHTIVISAKVSLRTQIPTLDINNRLLAFKNKTDSPITLLSQSFMTTHNEIFRAMLLTLRYINSYLYRHSHLVRTVRGVTDALFCDVLVLYDVDYRSATLEWIVGMWRAAILMGAIMPRLVLVTRSDCPTPFAEYVEQFGVEKIVDTNNIGIKKPTILLPCEYDKVGTTIYRFQKNWTEMPFFAPLYVVTSMRQQQEITKQLVDANAGNPKDYTDWVAAGRPENSVVIGTFMQVGSQTLSEFDVIYDVARSGDRNTNPTMALILDQSVLTVRCVYAADTADVSEIVDQHHHMETTISLLLSHHIDPRKILVGRAEARVIAQIKHMQQEGTVILGADGVLSITDKHIMHAVMGLNTTLIELFEKWDRSPYPLAIFAAIVSSKGFLVEQTNIETISKQIYENNHEFSVRDVCSLMEHYSIVSRCLEIGYDIDKHSEFDAFISKYKVQYEPFKAVCNHVKKILNAYHSITKKVIEVGPIDDIKNFFIRLLRFSKYPILTYTTSTPYPNYISKLDDDTKTYSLYPEANIVYPTHKEIVAISVQHHATASFVRWYFPTSLVS